MCSRRRVALLSCIAALSIAGCGGAGGDGYGCTGRTCVASFQGPGEQDLSYELGKGATVQVVTVDGASATVRVAGQNAKLLKDNPQLVGAFEVTLTETAGDRVTLRIRG